MSLKSPYLMSTSSINVSVYDDRSISVELRRSKRAKHMSLRADVYGICVVAPVNQSKESIHDFIHSRFHWLTRTYEYYSRIRQNIGGPVRKDTILHLGKRYRIRITKDMKQEYAIVSNNLHQITFHVKDKRTYKKFLRSWYLDQTKKILEERVPALSSRLSIGYTKFSIKHLKSRWGSCSKEGKLSFSHLLSMLPLEVIDYIIVHELVHLVEFNHSKKFWQHVEFQVPHYKQYRKWLRNHTLLVRVD